MKRGHLKLVHSRSEEDGQLIAALKSACECPDCDGWKHPERPAANHPCQPGPWYGLDNPYRPMLQEQYCFDVSALQRVREAVMGQALPKRLCGGLCQGLAWYALP
jgi:hypothetical protein